MKRRNWNVVLVAILCVSSVRWLANAQVSPTTQDVPGRDFYAKVLSVDDLDRVQIEYDGHRGVLRLRDVLPFSHWPKPASDAETAIHERALLTARDLMNNQTVLLVSPEVTNENVSADAFRFVFGPTKIERKWTGQSPAEAYKWGGFNLNVLLIQEGASTYVSRPKADGDVKSSNLLAAQKLAMEQRKGIWINTELGQRLADIAANGKSNTDSP